MSELCPVCGKGHRDDYFDGDHLDCVRQEADKLVECLTVTSPYWMKRAEQAEAERAELEKMLRMEYDDLLDEAGGHPWLSVSVDDWLADLRRRVQQQEKE